MSSINHIWRMTWSGRFKFQELVQLQSWWDLSGHPDTVIKDYDIYICIYIYMCEYLVMMFNDSMIKQSLFTFTWFTCTNQCVLHSPLVFLNFKVHVVLFPLRSPLRTLAVQCSSSPFRVNRALFRLWVPTCWYVMLNRLRKCPIWQVYMVLSTSTRMIFCCFFL